MHKNPMETVSHVQDIGPIPRYSDSIHLKWSFQNLHFKQEPWRWEEGGSVHFGQLDMAIQLGLTVSGLATLNPERPMKG